MGDEVAQELEMDGQRAAVVRNRFDRMEWAGACGNLGTLSPFVVAYISLLKMDRRRILQRLGAYHLLRRGLAKL